jgi:hypothetical protein
MTEKIKFTPEHRIKAILNGFVLDLDRRRISWYKVDHKHYMLMNTLYDFYSAIQELFGQVDMMDEQLPIRCNASAKDVDFFELQNDWTITEEAAKHLYSTERCISSGLRMRNGDRGEGGEVLVKPLNRRI